MARPLIMPPHLSLDEVEQRYRRAGDSVARSHWQIVWLLAGGTPTREVSRVTGYSVNWVRELARRYRVDGPAGMGGPAPDGGLWTGRQVAHWIAATLGRPVDPARGWEWMRRLGFTPQRPRPRETRADPAAQAAFKK